MKNEELELLFLLVKSEKWKVKNRADAVADSCSSLCLTDNQTTKPQNNKTTKPHIIINLLIFYHYGIALQNRSWQS